MPAAIPLPIRQRLIALVEEGTPTELAARTLGISPRSARRLRARASERAVQDDPLATDFHRCGRRRTPSFEAFRTATAAARQVERSQRTGKGWSEPGKCASAEELQARVDEEDRIQREVLAVQGGQSRWELHPQLRHADRWYTRGAEQWVWDWVVALLWLGAHVVRRRVSKDGKVSLYDRGVWVGRQYAGERVVVQLEVAQVHGEWVLNWVISRDKGRSEKGEVLARVPPSGLSAEEIRNGKVARPRKAASGQPQRRQAADKHSAG